MNIAKALNEIMQRRLQTKRYIRMDAGDWEENEHPRENNGRFAPKNGGGTGGGANGGETTAGEMSKVETSSSKVDRRSDTTKTKRGTSYPKLKNGAKYTKGLDEAETTALDDEEKGKIPKGTFEKVVKSLKPSDIVYMKDEYGEEIALIPGLAAKVDSQCKISDKMQKVFDDAKKDSETITSDMIDICSNAGLSMDKLENCCKGASHLEDKAQLRLEGDRKKHGIETSLEDVATNLGDAVRFTAVTNNDNYVNGVKSIISELTKRGYNVSEVENKFMENGKVNDDATYRAVHLTVEMPSGRKVEMQIQSAESLEVKNKNHKEYEEQRRIKLKNPDWESKPEIVKQMNDLDKIMIDRWHKEYTNPPGIEDIGSYDRRSKEYKRVK